MKQLTILLLAAQLSAATAENTSERQYQAIRSDDLPALRELASPQVVNLKDGRGTTPLMYAAAIGSAAAMQLLLQAGADSNAKNDFDASPLIWGAGDIRKVRLLLAKGADVNAHSKLGRTALMTAAYRDGGSKIVKLLVEKGATVFPHDNGQLTASSLCLRRMTSLPKKGNSPVSASNSITPTEYQLGPFKAIPAAG